MWEAFECQTLQHFVLSLSDNICLPYIEGCFKKRHLAVRSLLKKRIKVILGFKKTCLKNKYEYLRTPRQRKQQPEEDSQRSFWRLLFSLWNWWQSAEMCQALYLSKAIKSLHLFNRCCFCIFSCNNYLQKCHFDLHWIASNFD